MFSSKNEVVHDVEGGRTRAVCFGWALSIVWHIRIAQAQKTMCRWKNIMLEVEVDADRFACVLFYANYRKALDRRSAHGKYVRDDRHSGGDRPLLWEVYGKLVGSELTTLKANKVLGKLPDATSWAFNILMEHKSEIVGTRSTMWMTPGWASGPVWVMLCRLLGVRAQRVPSQSSIVAIFSLMPRRLQVLTEKQEACEISTLPHQVLCVPRCSE